MENNSVASYSKNKQSASSTADALEKVATSISNLDLSAKEGDKQRRAMVNHLEGVLKDLKNTLANKGTVISESNAKGSKVKESARNSAGAVDIKSNKSNISVADNIGKSVDRAADKINKNFNSALSATTKTLSGNIQSIKKSPFFNVGEEVQKSNVKTRINNPEVISNRSNEAPKKSNADKKREKTHDKKLSSIDRHISHTAANTTKLKETMGEVMKKMPDPKDEEKNGFWKNLKEAIPPKAIDKLIKFASLSVGYLAARAVLGDDKKKDGKNKEEEFYDENGNLINVNAIAKTSKNDLAKVDAIKKGDHIKAAELDLDNAIIERDALGKDKLKAIAEYEKTISADMKKAYEGDPGEFDALISANGWDFTEEDLAKYRAVADAEGKVKKAKDDKVKAAEDAKKAKEEQAAAAKKAEEEKKAKEEEARKAKEKAEEAKKKALEWGKTHNESDFGEDITPPEEGPEINITPAMYNSNADYTKMTGALAANVKKLRHQQNEEVEPFTTETADRIDATMKDKSKVTVSHGKVKSAGRHTRREKIDGYGYEFESNTSQVQRETRAAKVDNLVVEDDVFGGHSERNLIRNKSQSHDYEDFRDTVRVVKDDRGRVVAASITGNSAEGQARSKREIQTNINDYNNLEKSGLSGEELEDAKYLHSAMMQMKADQMNEKANRFIAKNARVSKEEAAAMKADAIISRDENNGLFIQAVNVMNSGINSLVALMSGKAISKDVQQVEDAKAAASGSQQMPPIVNNNTTVINNNGGGGGSGGTATGVMAVNASNDGTPQSRY